MRESATNRANTRSSRSLTLYLSKQFMNPNQAKIVTTAFQPGEAHVLTAEAELLFAGGTIFRVSNLAHLRASGAWSRLTRRALRFQPGGPGGAAALGPAGQYLPQQLTPMILSSGVDPATQQMMAMVAARAVNHPRTSALTCCPPLLVQMLHQASRGEP